jgi:hypothetical protein
MGTLATTKFLLAKTAGNTIWAIWKILSAVVETKNLVPLLDDKNPFFECIARLRKMSRFGLRKTQNFCDRFEKRKKSAFLEMDAKILRFSEWTQDFCVFRNGRKIFAFFKMDAKNLRPFWKTQFFCDRFEKRKNLAAVYAIELYTQKIKFCHRGGWPKKLSRPPKTKIFKPLKLHIQSFPPIKILSTAKWPFF